MKLFERGRIGKLQVKNRIVMAPMAIGGLVEPDGRFSQEAIAYYRERAKGGVGLIITGLATVDSQIERNLLNGWAAFPRLDSGAYVPRLSKLADAIHDYGGRLALQMTAGFGRVAAQFLMRQGQPPGPSSVPCFHDSSRTTREMTRDEIRALVKAFGRAARVAQAAGVDAIELHGHEGYLLDQFKTALWNQRQDEYGGSLDKRLRFPREVVAAIKDAVGEDLPVIYRVGLEHHLEGGRHIDEGLEILRSLEAAGVDAFHVDAGCYETWQWAHPPLYQPRGCLTDMAAAAKKVVRVPVIAVGRLGYPELAESLLTEGKADFIAMGRALLADADWPIKVRSGQQRNIRPCIGDHDGCIGRSFKGKPLSCSVNPAVGLEEELRLQPATVPRRVVVVGGGPAGMEAARVAAIRGHKVTLLERSERLGGTLVPGSVPSFKQDLRALVTYLEGQLSDLEIDVRLGAHATRSKLEALQPDVVLLATGASPVVPSIAGVRSGHVLTAIEVLSERQCFQRGAKVVVLGGGEVGCEIAVHLADHGCDVTVIEMMSKLLRGVFEANRLQLLEMMRGRGVAVRTGTKLQEIRENAVLLASGDMTEELACDFVVLAAGLAPNQQLASDVEGLCDVRAIGDCVHPRNVFHAMHEGFRVARLI